MSTSIDGAVGVVADKVTAVVIALYARAVIHGRDRGDVPGWVLVTIMTAGLVTTLWLVADDKLRQLFNDALDGVTGSSP
jgi:hypothetical protein